MTPNEERPRRGIAQVLYAPHGRFKKIILAPGETRVFGRDERAEVRLRDEQVRGAHFDVSFDGLAFTVREHGKGHLLIDGQPSFFGHVRSGGFVVAGQTTVRLFLERRTPTLSGGLASEERVAEVLNLLEPAKQAGSLYAVLDAARDPRVRVLLDEAIDDHASLYEGVKGAVLDDVAPYMVRFRDDSDLLFRLVSEGWGQSWGLFLAMSEPWKIVRRHLRRFLMVLDDRAHERMYFRFYDPRVMREFMKIATPRQRAQLLYGLDQMVLENEDFTPILLEGSGAQEDHPMIEEHA